VADQKESETKPRYALPGFVGVTGMLMLFWGIAPIIEQQSALARASATARGGALEIAGARHLAVAQTVLPDPRIALRHSALNLQLAESALARKDVSRLQTQLNRAQEILAESRQHGLQLGQLWRAEANLCLRAAQMTGDKAWLGRGFDAAAQMLGYMPYDTTAHVLAGDIAWQAQRHEQAARWYGQALELDEQMWLDPTKQMPETERNQLVKRIAPGSDAKKEGP
jgi:tetratricopeptide (TPR) repeat protein